MLDSDDYELVDGKGMAAKRDIVQFVRFNDFKDEMISDASKLAEAVLAEVPDQLVGFMMENNHKIGEPLAQKDDENEGAF